jgi:hypothetical protein
MSISPLALQRMAVQKNFQAVHSVRNIPMGRQHKVTPARIKIFCGWPDSAWCTLKVSPVKAIAKFMFLNGYDKECFQAYINTQQNGIDKYFAYFRLDKLNLEELVNTNWNKLSSLIWRWNRAMRVFIGLYLASEKRLSNHVFGELSDSTADMCFYEISFNPLMQLLSFYE